MRSKPLDKMFAFDAKSAVSVAAVPNKEQIAIAFGPMGDEPGVTVMLPAGAVGHMMVQLKAEHTKIALSHAVDQAVMLPLALTGARAFWEADGSPILMLQFDGVFELAVSLSRSQADSLGRVSQQLSCSAPDALPKRH